MARRYHTCLSSSACAFLLHLVFCSPSTPLRGRFLVASAWVLQGCDEAPSPACSIPMGHKYHCQPPSLSTISFLADDYNTISFPITGDATLLTPLLLSYVSDESRPDFDSSQAFRTPFLPHSHLHSPPALSQLPLYLGDRDKCIYEPVGLLGFCVNLNVIVNGSDSVRDVRK